MFNVLKKWFGKTRSKNVVITEEQAQVIIGHLIENIENQEQEYLGHIFNLETMIKSVVLTNGGQLTVPRDIVQLLTESQYDLITNEGEDGNLMLSLEEHVCQNHECDEEGDE